MQKLFLKILIKSSNKKNKKKKKRMRPDVIGMVSQAQCLAHKERACARGLIFFFLNHHLPHSLLKKNKQRVVYSCIECSHYSGQKNRFLFFFNSKTYFNLFFYPKHLENTLKILFNQSIALKKNTRNHPKTHNQPKAKSLLELRYMFWVFSR